jgi:hypothetical protein
MRSNSFVALLLVVSGISAFSQSLERQKITWADFHVAPDWNSPDLACTCWSVRFFYQNPQPGAKGTRFQFRVWTQLEDRSWVKLDGLSAPSRNELLAHEQGHYDVGLICALLFYQAIVNHEFSTDPRAEASKILADEVEKAREMDLAYDREARHGSNSTKQAEWEKKTASIINQLWPVLIRANNLR